MRNASSGGPEHFPLPHLDYIGEINEETACDMIQWCEEVAVKAARFVGMKDTTPFEIVEDIKQLKIVVENKLGKNIKEEEKEDI